MTRARGRGKTTGKTKKTEFPEDQDPNVIISEQDSSNPDMDISQNTSGEVFTTPTKNIGERQKTPQNLSPMPGTSDQGASNDNNNNNNNTQMGMSKAEKDLNPIQYCLGGSGLESTRKPDEASTTVVKGQKLKFFIEKFDVDDLDGVLVPIRLSNGTLRLPRMNSCLHHRTR